MNSQLMGECGLCKDNSENMATLFGLSRLEEFMRSASLGQAKTLGTPYYIDIYVVDPSSHKTESYMPVILHTYKIVNTLPFL